ncbi:hypothetical protein ACH3XW_34035 [Acanthocheilonema viteae]
MDQIWFVLLLQLSFLKSISIRGKCPLCIRHRYFEQKMIEQCPCVKPPGSNECLSYDNRLQAANIDEALHTFPDLSSLTEDALPLVPDENIIMMKSTSQFLLSQKAIYKSPKTYKCDGKECQACKLLITNAFQRANDNKFPTAGSSVSQLSDDIDESFLLGVAITISCNYKKGEEIAQGWTGLCNLCWQWRKLPTNYFPVLLNEISCDTNDKGCLAGFGNCRSVMRSINVLRNLGTHKSPRWMQESINTVSACECQVEIGTPLHSLVLR